MFSARWLTEIPTNASDSVCIQCRNWQSPLCHSVRISWDEWDNVTANTTINLFHLSSTHSRRTLSNYWHSTQTHTNTSVSSLLCFACVRSFFSVDFAYAVVFKSQLLIRRGRQVVLFSSFVGRVSVCGNKDLSTFTVYWMLCSAIVIHFSCDWRMRRTR